ncbi:hypothetical protein WUBG_09715 [Wuchereria bancrofti]|uniref:Uncharacterized protein n=1 Tax=Wuchereria bancrofti TaxID=6293 RepID=J9EAI3_WUCBA|nr:hypothetical protein WUBG_09715 [Wuchereria bancrofti]
MVGDKPSTRISILQDSFLSNDDDDVMCAAAAATTAATTTTATAAAATTATATAAAAATVAAGNGMTALRTTVMAVKWCGGGAVAVRCGAMLWRC